MSNENRKIQTRLDQLAAILLHLPWLEIVTDLWKAGKKVLRGLADEGMYEVINYESIL